LTSFIICVPRPKTPVYYNIALNVGCKNKITKLLCDHQLKYLRSNLCSNPYVRCSDTVKSPAFFPYKWIKRILVELEYCGWLWLWIPTNNILTSHVCSVIYRPTDCREGRGGIYLLRLNLHPPWYRRHDVLNKL